MAERDEFGAFLIGFFIGGITGAITALLLAPQSGEETRTVIRERAIELRDRTAETLGDAYAQAEAAAAEARTRADELTKIALERAEDLKRRGQVVVEEQVSRVSGAIQQAKKPGATDAQMTPPDAEV